MERVDELNANSGIERMSLVCYLYDGGAYENDRDTQRRSGQKSQETFRRNHVERFVEQLFSRLDSSTQDTGSKIAAAQ